MGIFDKFQKNRYNPDSLMNSIPKRRFLGMIYAVVLTGVGIVFGFYKILFLTVPMLIIQGILYLRTTKVDKDAYNENLNFSDLDFDEEEGEEDDKGN